MSTAVLPTLAGLGFDVVRTPQWDTVIQQSLSGKETRIAKQSYPRWKWELRYNVLRSTGPYTELQQLAGFFNQRQGKFDTFLYQDADDNSVLGQTIGTGDGVTKQFQLIRAFGGFIEPVIAPNAFNALYINGVSVPSSGLTQPNAPILGSVSSGSLGVTTYYVKTTWTAAHGETLPSTEVSLTVAANNILTVTQSSSAPAGALGFNIYVSTSSGTETRQNSSPIGVTGTWQEPASGLISGAALPTANTTIWYVSIWGAASPGVLNFIGVPAAGTTIAADFTYYWPVRMDNDSVSFNMFLSGYYKTRKFGFISVKN